MTTPLETFEQQLARFGLLELEQAAPIKARLRAPEGPQRAQEFARELIRSGLLTKYQAVRTLQGHAKELVLGQYVILDKVGAGGMGEVFKARHRAMGRIVALKILPRSEMNSPESVRRFKREVKAAARLTHPNIVTAFDADETGGVHYLVMEFVDGEDLHNLVRREGALPFGQALDYILQAAQGLAYAHANGVIHRDIKPHNLLLNREGTVKILDVGQARIEHGFESAGGRSSGVTGSGVISGTLDCMPPEQAADTRQADQRSDIYALGCTLYWMIVGETPFRGETAAQKLLAHREAAIPSIVQKRPELPQQIDQIFQRMVAKRPEDRYPSLNEVIHDLKGLSSGRLLKARVVTDAPSEDNQLANFLAGTLSQGAVPVVAGKSKPSPRRKKSSAAPVGLLIVAALALFVSGGLYLLLSRENPPLRPPATVAKVEQDAELPVVLTEAPEPPVAAPAPPVPNKPPPAAGPTKPVQTAPEPAPAAVRLISLDGPAEEVLHVPDLEEPMTALCFTPDGRQLLLAGQDGATRLFDLGQREVVWKQQGPANPVSDLVCEPDGQHYVISGAGGDVRRWNLSARTQAWSKMDERSAPLGLACSYDEQLVATAYENGIVVIRTLFNGEAAQRIDAHEGPARSVAFSPDDRRLLSGGGGELPLALWSVESGERDTNLPGHDADVLCVAISPDGRFAASGDEAGTLLVWDFRALKQLHLLETWHDKVDRLAFTPDSRRLVSSGRKDERLRVLNVETGDAIHEFYYPDLASGDLSLSRDGRLVAVSAADKSLRVFRTP